MLAVDRRRFKDDQGAALVAVIVVMLVGVVVTAAIASSVIFAMSSNAKNKNQTQAFVAAESGRDALLAKVLAPACELHAGNGDPATGPVYEADAMTGADEGTLGSACPASDSSSVIVITSTGRDVDAAGNVLAETTIRAVYHRQVSITNQPGGTVSYFAGQFKVRQSSYAGDLVIRDRPYLCNSTAVITGNLWVLDGPATFSADCTITGSIYAQGAINITSAKVKVGGDLVSATGVTLKSSQAVVSGGVYTDGNFQFDSGTLNGKYVAGGTKSGTGVPGAAASSIDHCATIPSDPKCLVPEHGTVVTSKPGTDQTVPSLADVEMMTRWKDISATRGGWGSDVQWITMTSGECAGTNALGKIPAALDAGKTRIGFDYSACASSATVKVGTNPKAIKYDMVFLVPPSARMNVQVSGGFTLTGAPQLFVIHGDGDITSDGPNCNSGQTDSLSVSNADTVRLMVYTPCGLGSANHLTFNGQYYSNDAGEPDWVQSTFQCRDMTWDPVIDLSCQITDAAQQPGDIVTKTMPAELISQSEVPNP